MCVPPRHVSGFAPAAPLWSTRVARGLIFCRLMSCSVKNNSGRLTDWQLVTLYRLSSRRRRRRRRRRRVLAGFIATVEEMATDSVD